MPAETVFYDGDCGLCHSSVRFLLRADREGLVFRYAPLQGETFRARIPAHARQGLPDSIVVLTADGRLLTRSDGTAHLLRQLGGLWGALGRLLAAVPRPLRDAGYDLVARIRHRLFARPEGVCPVVSPQFRARFDP